MRASIQITPNGEYPWDNFYVSDAIVQKSETSRLMHLILQEVSRKEGTLGNFSHERMVERGQRIDRNYSHLDPNKTMTSDSSLLTMHSGVI